MTAIPSQESIDVEFKSDQNKLPDNDLIEAVICLANAQGGTLYLGVEDDGQVTGLHPDRPQQVTAIAALVANRTSPGLSVRTEVIPVNDLRVLVISVAQSTDSVARSDGLIKRRRIGSNGKPECVPFLPHEYASKAAFKEAMS